MSSKREILLNPGPVTLSPAVRAALQKPDLCHREKEFAAMTLDTLKRISDVYDTSAAFSPVMLTGSGTAAVEAMLQSFAPAEKKCLIVANGVYGERMATMLTRQKKPFDLIKGDWTSGLQLAQAESLLQENSYAAILTVHHETTTGRLNDIAALSNLGKTYNTPLMLDAVSSFGAEDIEFGNMLAVAATGNKCLHAIPGISFVIAQTKVLESDLSQAVSLYLDLFEYFKAQKSGFSPFTQSVQALYTLQAALDEFFAQGGQPARKKLYLDRRNAVLATLEKAGIKTLIERASFSSYLTSFLIPEHIAGGYEALHDLLKSEGYTIYAGQGNFSGKIFRIAVMGDIQDVEIEKLNLLLTGFFSAKN